MADFEGAVGGIEAFHRDEDTQVATQERQAQIQHLGALTQQEQMQTQVLGAKLQREQALQKIANMKPGVAGQDEHGDVSPAARMEEIGTRLMDAGLLKEGSDLLNKSSEVKNREAMQKAASDRAKVALYAMKQKQLESLHNMLAAGNDEESANQARMVWMSENPGETLPPELQHYNKPLWEVLKKATRVGQEEARRDQAATREEDRKKAKEADQAERKRRNDMLERHQKALERDRERRTNMLGKTGGKPSLTGANTTDIQAAQAMIMKDYPDIAGDIPLTKAKDSLMVSSAAYDLANEAKAKRGKNPALSMPEAMTQVYAEMRKNGDFRVTANSPSLMDKLTKKIGMDSDPGKHTEYKPLRNQPAQPYVAGVTKPEKDVVYDPGDGSKWHWDGKNMISVE